LTDERLCVACAVLSPARERPRHYDRPNVCDGCRRRLALTLAELPGLCEALPAAYPKLQRPQINGSRIRSTPQASEPINWWPFDLASPADPRKRELAARVALGTDPEAEWQDGVLSVATELDGMVRDWLTYRPDEHEPALTVESLCRWLSHRLEWACERHPAVDEFAGDLVELARAVRSAGRVDSGVGTFVGRCPTELRDGSRCGRPLRVDMVKTDDDGTSSSGFVIACRCGSSWDRHRGEWVGLAAAQERAGLARWQEPCSTPTAAEE
jgi:hypothetical protein